MSRLMACEQEVWRFAKIDADACCPRSSKTMLVAMGCLHQLVTRATACGRDSCWFQFYSWIFKLMQVFQYCFFWLGQMHMLCLCANIKDVPDAMNAGTILWWESWPVSRLYAYLNLFTCLFILTDSGVHALPSYTIENLPDAMEACMTM